MAEGLVELHAQLFTKSMKSRLAAQRHYDKAVASFSYEVGDRVLL